MQLIKLSANKSSFRTISFKPGLNIILARKSNPQDKDMKKTYNGVGKSLSIALIHFCLGSGSNKEFQEKLPDWEFALEIEIDGEKFIIKRSTAEQDIIRLNNKEYTPTEFREFMGRKLFYLDAKPKFLNFRPLICRFMRPRKRSYVSFKCYEGDENNTTSLVNTSYLLGLEIKYILKKWDLKRELDKIDLLSKNIKKDKIVKNYFLEKGQGDINIFDIKEKIRTVREDLNNFRVAENYQLIVNEANELSSQLDNLNNQLVILQDAVQNINESLKINPDISKDKIISLYEEAKIKFDDKVTKEFSEIERFHKSLLANRKERLLKEKAEFVEEITKKEETKKNIGLQLNQKLQYLETHGAIEKRIALTSQLHELENMLNKVSAYKDMLSQYSRDRTKVEIKMKEDSLETNNYLEDFSSTLDKNVEIFRSFSSKFYNKAGGIKITNDEGENQTRFHIDASIEDDASDGINEVKIFCFDLTLLKAKHNHKIDFIFHDSRLFSDMDARQRATALKVAFQESDLSKIQYIASINEDHFLPAKQEYYTEEEYKKIIEENTILELTDESDEKKLLGIKVDMKYDED